ncbi:hypothetical protein BDN72DRAFT_883640 [Pluteus cervinus]|uniref:Uncharacterized protein n=1 Tax=Pluteus cervinus TaxID=181527 RepID=A0ACD3A3U7_9AGAR|nr:hypothetical protein BDN72DRAFT_883640 [Pluteus cervinus]
MFVFLSERLVGAGTSRGYSLDLLHPPSPSSELHPKHVGQFSSVNCCNKSLMLELEPRLPPEIERLIFEDVAWMYRSSIPRLILVCRRVKDWTESILYSIVIRRSETPYPSYEPPIERLPAYACHVHSFLAFFEIDGTIIRDYLRLCKNLTNLALWCEPTCPDLLQLLEELPRLRNLTIYLSAVFPDGPPYTLESKSGAFQGLTHLELMDDEISWKDISGFVGGLEGLTHLALNDINDEQLVCDILENCPRIRVLVLFESSELKVLGSSKVVFAKFSLDAYVGDWISVAEGRECFWDKAEREVIEKEFCREYGYLLE